MSGCNWLATLNNPTEGGEDILRAWSKSPKVAYVTGQLEKGAEGTVHLQFFLNYVQKVRMAHLKK